MKAASKPYWKLSDLKWTIPGLFQRFRICMVDLSDVDPTFIYLDFSHASMPIGKC